MLSEKQALRKREKLITWLIAIVVALALLIAFVVIIKNQMNNPEKVGLRDKMSLDVNYWLFRKGYTTPVITIENLQDTARKDCEITINDKYIFEIKEIPSSDVNHDVITINTNDFVREDGMIFDSISDPVRSACIICKKPFYNSYCGDFTR